MEITMTAIRSRVKPKAITYAVETPDGEDPVLRREMSIDRELFNKNKDEERAQGPREIEVTVKW